MSPPDFTVEISQNEYLTAGAREVDAIVTVTSDGSAPHMPLATPGAAGGAEIIIVGCSGSMGVPMKKMNEARRAAAAAIDAIRDGVAFAVVAGTHVARQVYPGKGLITADARTKKAAYRALRRLYPDGGTAIGQWLRLARELFETSDEALRHAILLTDGQNEGEPTEKLADAIELCEGYFSCDRRGVGTDWKSQ
jgi:Mg-chelatase subunit ChlD